MLHCTSLHVCKNNEKKKAQPVKQIILYCKAYPWTIRFVIPLLFWHFKASPSFLWMSLSYIFSSLLLFVLTPIFLPPLYCCHHNSMRGDRKAHYRQCRQFQVFVFFLTQLEDKKPLRLQNKKMAFSKYSAHLRGGLATQNGSVSTPEAWIVLILTPLLWDFAESVSGLCGFLSRMSSSVLLDCALYLIPTPSKPSTHFPS